jgi:hypothetical protein
MRNVVSNGLPSFVVPEMRWTLREYAILPSESISDEKSAFVDCLAKPAAIFRYSWSVNGA